MITGKSLSLVLSVGCLVLLLTGCPGVYLTNNTEEIFRFGKDSPYEFRLEVKRANQAVPSSSVRAYIWVNGTRHDMSGSGFSEWSYVPQEPCPDVGFADDYGFKYSFSVDYDRGNIFVKSPPRRLPSTGQLHAKVLNAGTMGFSGWDISYPEECIETNLGCVATFQYEHVVDFGDWPGNPNNYEYTLVLRNLTQDDYPLVRIALVSYGGNPPNDRFELIGIDNLPVSVGCEQTYSFRLRYKPGYYEDPNFVSGYYREQGMIQTWRRAPDGQWIHGPHLYIDYTVYQNAP